MKRSVDRAINYLATLPRIKKSLLMLVADFVLLPISLWTALGLRLGVWSFPQYTEEWWVYFLPSLIAIPIFIRVGLYRAVVRHMDDRALITISAAVTASVWLFVGVLPLLTVPSLPRGALVIFWLIALMYIGAGRFLARAVLLNFAGGFVASRKKAVAIYGAGSAGRQLCMALRAGQQYLPVAFVDDNEALHRLNILGLTVYPPRRLSELIVERDIHQVLLAIPSASRGRRIEIINDLERLTVEVRAIPGMADLVGGEVRLADIREVEIDELLGRDSVPPYQQLLDANVKNKSVMVTGAGGSIGAELSRQIVQIKPYVLVLYEQSEFALYTIEQELLELIRQKTLTVKLVTVLGSVRNEQRLHDIMSQYSVQTVYHAAAYKHVPIVEFNMVEGIENNTFGTRATASAAIEAGVETFVLISTDKAVRPTNVMGASKRMAELILQAYANDSNVKTRFCMVRFGNVLGSSGSVVPVFRSQIAAGGPVTVTHPNITRYFMTIPEAAQLVIQAGALGAGGEVFVLDMGEPVKIQDLARRMIHLSGFSVRDERHPEGDIEISFAGLRPGEKLYEELLIGDDVIGSKHPKIMMASEQSLPPLILDERLKELGRACSTNDHEAILKILCACVSGFSPEAEIRDYLYGIPATTHALVH